MMIKRSMLAGLAAAALLAPPQAALAEKHEHEDQQGQMAPQQGMPGMMERCMQHHQQVMSGLDQMARDMEQARASNDPARMREALDRSVRQMRQMRSQMQANMRDMQAMRSRMGSMMMGGGAGPAAAVRQQYETACGRPLDPATAPQTAYQGRLYYFCSEGEKRQFERDPEGFMRRRSL